MLLEKYQSKFLDEIKENANKEDEEKFVPFKIEFEDFDVYLPRFFGFCFGVRNAIKIVSNAIDENKDKKKYLLSEIIHNQNVNDDLIQNGINFIFEGGKQKVSYDDLKEDDVCIIPAFGAEVETFNILDSKLNKKNIYDTCCPFVKKVWSACKKIGDEGATIIIHGKFNHEETKATFSFAKKHGKAIVIKDEKEANILKECIINNLKEKFYEIFSGVISENFDFENDFKKVGVVNQTTMLANDTILISNIIKEAITKSNGEFLDNSDTLCYTTSRNQKSVKVLMEENLDLVLVVGGFNSSNTTNLYKIAKEKCKKTYFIKDDKSIISKNKLKCLDESSKEKKEIIIEDYLKGIKKIGIIAGASCPDILIEKIIGTLLATNEKKC